MGIRKLLRSGWGNLNPRDEVNFHADGPVGRAIARMGEDAFIDVDGEYLGDRLGK